MRDLLMFVALLFLIPLSFRSAFNAYLLWGWTGLISINTYLYGFMSSIQYVQLFSIIALFLILIKKDNALGSFKINTTIVLLLIFATQVLFSATFAYPGLARNWERCTDLLKTVLFCLCMPMVLTNRNRIYAFVLMLVIGSAFHGMLNGLKFIASGGAHMGIGPDKLGDNNHFAMVMVMTLPLILYIYAYSAYKWVKFGTISIFILTVLTVIATRSRGGLISITAMGFWLLKVSKRKVIASMSLLGVAVLIVAVAPDSWSERMNTINNVHEDSSFMTRVAAWKKSTAIALENPFLGGGLDAVASPSLAGKFNEAQGLMGFISTPNPYNYVAHSIYFQVMGDLGFVGFSLFLILLINVFRTRNQIKRLSASYISRFRWAVDLSDMLTASMIAYVVGGALLSAAYFELPYILIMLMECIKQQIIVAIAKGDQYAGMD